MRAKLKDIKQGKTFYSVQVIYSACGNPSVLLSKILIACRPYVSLHTKTLFVDYYDSYSKYMNMAGRQTRSLKDDNVLPNSYNLHALFTTRKSAERYVQNIKDGRLTDREEDVCQRNITSANDEYSRWDYCDFDMDDYEDPMLLEAAY